MGHGRTKVRLVHDEPDTAVAPPPELDAVLDLLWASIKVVRDGDATTDHAGGGPNLVGLSCMLAMVHRSPSRTNTWVMRRSPFDGAPR